MSTLHVTAADDLDVASLHAILRLRCDVFIVEQACAYADVDGRDLDSGTCHLWLTGPEPEHRDVLAYLRILQDPDGVARIGRVCVAPSARRQGHAAILLAAALDVIGTHEAVLDAQAYATDLYANVGFVTDGPEFMEDGIPHLPMRRPGHVANDPARPQ